MKKIKLFFLCALVRYSFFLSAGGVMVTSVCWAQEIEWQNTIGGSANDYLYYSGQTADGGYILCGYSGSGISGDKTENTNGGWDYWIVKTDATGNIQWQNAIGGSQTDYLYTAGQTADGGVILGGTSTSNISGDKTENGMGTYDYWIVKTDATGNIQWQNTIGGSAADWLQSIQQTADGGYILGGYSVSNISGDKTENTNGANDYWIVKTDATGNIQWQNTIGGNNNDHVYSIQQTTDGGYMLGGISNSDISGDKTENKIGLYDYWIIKTDATGNIQWQNTIGGGSDDYLQSLQQTADGGYILGGRSESMISGDKTENCKGGYDYWIVKTDAMGNIQWQNTIGGSGHDYLQSLQQTADGRYILGGRSESNISGNKFENSNGAFDYWIVKTDAAGNIQSQNTIGGNGDDWSFSIQQCAIGGGYIVGGYSNSNISGDKTENFLGSTDYWMVKLTDDYNLITGKCYVDFNSNSVQDAGEHSLQNKKITEVNTGRFAFSQGQGMYYVGVLDTGSFTVTCTPTINYYNAVPATHSATLTGMQQTDSLNDFAFQPAGAFNDLCVSITPLGQFRSGFNASYMINYGNYGTTTLSGDVIFFPFNNVTYVSSNTAPTSVTLDSVVWGTGVLAPFQTGSILVTVNVNVGTPIGSLINSSVRIEPVANDANPGCNYSHWEVYTTGSFDPNDILVNEDTLTTTQLSAAPFLDYIIRFQNTGNDTAFTVKVINPIDTNMLELSTIEFVNASHPVNLNWISYQRNMEFKFDNILLPDSNTNEPASHGFVHYRIKPKTTLLAGSNINNNAFIYFDFNSPVATNIAVTKIVLPTSISSLQPPTSSLYLYPNPAKNELTVTGLKFDTGDVLTISDLLGKHLITKTVSQPTENCKLQTANLSNGMYLLTVKTKAGATTRKIIKEN